MRLPKLKVLSLESQQSDNLINSAIGDLDYKLYNLPKKKFIDRLINKDYDVLMLGYGLTLRQVDHLSIFFKKDSFHNFARVNDQEINGLVDSLWRTNSHTESTKIYKRIIEKNTKNNWYIPLTYAPLMFAISDKLIAPIIDENKNFTIDSPAFDLTNVRLKSK